MVVNFNIIEDVKTLIHKFPGQLTTDHDDIN